MKTFFYSIVAIVSLLLCSCGPDSLEKLSSDKAEHMDEMTVIMEGVADGSLSSTDAAEEIKAWGKKGEKLVERTNALKGDKTEEEMIKDADALPDDVKAAMSASLAKYIKASQKAVASGKMTSEIVEAMDNVKN